MATVARVERALTHQTVYAGFGTQPAVGVFAFHPNGSAFNTGHFRFGYFHQFAFKPVRFNPAQVHTQQHVGPVLGFGAAGTGLNFHVAVAGVQFAGEHTAEFQRFQFFLQGGQFSADVVNGRLVVFFHRHIQQVTGIAEAVVEGVDGFYHRFQRRALFAQLLGAFGVVPHIALRQFVFDFF